MVVENTTPNRGYQLPHATNDLNDDVARLIAAIMGIDVEIAAMLVAIAGKADAEHGHVIADITGLAAALAARQELSEKGQANGYAALGPDGKVPGAQLPAALFGALSYQGVWNASTNSPTIPAAAAGNKGYFYKVSVAGTTAVSGINDWGIGDWIVSNGASWDKVDNTDQVLSVAGLQGAISAAALTAALAQSSATDTTAGKLMAVGAFGVGAQAILSEVDVLNYPPGGHFISPAVGLLNLPDGWPMTRYHVETTGGTSYKAVRLTGTLNPNLQATNVWNGTSWIGWRSPLLKNGDSMEGGLGLMAGTTASASLRMPHGVAPTSPVNGDLWLPASGGFYGHRNNVTVALWDTSSLVLPSQSEAETGTATTERVWSAQRVKQAIVANAPASPVGLYTGSDGSYTNYPIGHTVLVDVATAPPARNASATITNKSGGTAFGIAPDGVTISGTWRHRGAHLYQRTA